MSRAPDTVRDVAPQEWRGALTALRDEGHVLWAFLTVIDRGDRLDVIARVERPDPFQAALVRCAVAEDDPRLESVGDLWAGASWHQREAHEMFGLRFTGPANGAANGLATDLVDDRPLLLRERPVVPPMRRTAWLPARIARAWPGAYEPSQGSGNASRRRLLPPGVPVLPPGVPVLPPGVPAAPEAP